MNIRNWFGNKPQKISYAQCGEDIIVEFLLEQLGIKQPTYLDIGAHHPVYLSNTYYFYKKGCSGVCIEPDPDLHRVIAAKRHRDICLNVGVGVNELRQANFYVMTTRTLNTFSEPEAKRYASYGQQRIENIVQIPLVPLDQLIEQHFQAAPDFVSLDVEGMDFEILTAFDFHRFQPPVFCIETLTYTEDKTERKIIEIIDHMRDFGYLVYADTYINTIFVQEDAWKNR